MSTETKNANGPFYKKTLSRLRISVFENVSEKDNKIRFSTYIQRTYKAANGEWRLGAFSEEDLDDLPTAVKLAQEQIAERKARYSKEQLAA
jgi:hypothetical protein